MIIKAITNAQRFSRVKIAFLRKSVILFSRNIDSYGCGDLERMKRLVFVVAAMLILLTACASGATGTDKAKQVAQSQMSKDGFATAAITNVAKGDATAKGAD